MHPRGIGNLIRQAILSRPPSTPLHFYSSSGGNAGIAAVTAASTLGYPATVVVPLSTKEMMIEKIKVAGAAEVIQRGMTWFEADQYLQHEVIPTAEARGEVGVYVPPFDHQDVWDGAATMVDEIERQLGGMAARGGPSGGSGSSGAGNTQQEEQRARPDVVICSVGGGGMFCGLSQGFQRSQQVSNSLPSSSSPRPRTQIIAVETKGAESLHESIKAKSLITLPGITSIATTLGAVRVAPKAFEYGMAPHCSSVVVTDKQAVEACWLFADEERILVEPSCGASLAVLYSGLLKETLEQKGIEVTPDTKVVVIVCGGVGVTVGMLEQWKGIYGF